MVEQQVPKQLLVFRRFMAQCIRSKNLKGRSPTEIRAAFAECAEAFKAAREAITPTVNITELAERAAQDFLRAQGGR